MVQLASTLTTALLATTALAAPSRLAARDGTKPPSQCATKGGSVSNYWGVYLNDNTMGGWGKGYLDNLRGRCGAITDWQAEPDGHGGIACTFNASKFCQASDVSAALNAASGEWIHCDGDTMNGLFDTAGNFIKEYVDYLQAVSGILQDFAK